MVAADIRQAQTPSDMDAVRALCWEYRAYLLDHGDEVRRAVSVSYALEAYTALMASLEEKHARPKGIVLLAEIDGRAVGCGMTHPLNQTDAEIKRVFVREEARGNGIAATLSQRLVDQAREDGYGRVLLDTSRQFHGAQRLYERLGFRACGPYSELPPGIAELLVFYELSL